MLGVVVHTYNSSIGRIHYCECLANLGYLGYGDFILKTTTKTEQEYTSMQ